MKPHQRTKRLTEQRVFRVIGTLGLLILVCQVGCCSFRQSAIDARISKARDWTSSGLTALHHDRCDQAELFLEKAREACPEDKNIRKHLAEALQRQGEVDQAIEHLEFAIRDSSNASGLHVDLGNLYLQKSLPNVALQHADAALQQDRQQALAWELRGASLLAQSRLQEALQSLQMAVKYTSDSESSLHLEIGKIYRMLNRHENALNAFELYVNQYPTDQVPLAGVLQMGQVLSDVGYEQRAVAILAQATQRADCDASIWIALSQAQWRAGDRSNAKLTAYAAQQKFPEDSGLLNWVDELEPPVRTAVLQTARK